MGKRVECIISGRVQLVMFRDFAERKARGLGIAGTVQNMSDGTVRVIAEGEESALRKYLELLRVGPIFAKVENVETAWLPATGEFQKFKIIY